MRPAANLGDTYDESSSEDGDFGTPERAENETSYNLRYSDTSQPTRLPKTKPPKSNTAKKKTQPTARKRTTNLLQNNANQASTSQQATAANKESQKKQTRGRRKQKNPQSWEQQNKNFLKEVRKLVNRTDNLVPRLPFGRLVREIIYNNSRFVDRITVLALQALQESTEQYITQVCSDAYFLTLHRGRVTLTPRDLKLLLLLKPMMSS